MALVGPGLMVFWTEVLIECDAAENAGDDPGVFEPPV